MEGLSKINQENKEEKRKIEILKENLKEIFDPSKYSTFGHGTGREQAESILMNGIESSTNALDETAIHLDDTDESYSKILNWKHHDSKFIVIIMIPNPTGDLRGYTYFDNVFDELSENRRSNTSYYGRGFGREYYVKPQFIKGYVNVNSLSFIKNKLYDPDTKVEIKEIPYIEPSRRKALQTSGMSEDEINKLLLKSSESDDDWS